MDNGDREEGEESTWSTRPSGGGYSPTESSTGHQRDLTSTNEQTVSHTEDPTVKTAAETISHSRSTSGSHSSRPTHNYNFSESGNMTESSSFHTNATFTEAMNLTGTGTRKTPTEPTVTAQTEESLKRRKREVRNRNRLEKEVVSQCISENCRCSNLTVTNLEYQMQVHFFFSQL